MDKIANFLLQLLSKQEIAGIKTEFKGIDQSVTINNSDLFKIIKGTYIEKAAFNLFLNLPNEINSEFTPSPVTALSGNTDSSIRIKIDVPNPKVTKSLGTYLTTGDHYMFKNDNIFSAERVKIDSSNIIVPMPINKVKKFRTINSGKNINVTISENFLKIKMDIIKKIFEIDLNTVDADYRDIYHGSTILFKIRKHPVEQPSAIEIDPSIIISFDSNIFQKIFIIQYLPRNSSKEFYWLITKKS